MPDWRNGDDYAYARDLTPHGWAWEFLRRNPAYRARWTEREELSAALDLKPGNKKLVQRFNKVHVSSGEFGLLSFRNPDLTATEADPFWLGAVGVSVQGASTERMIEEGTWPGFPFHISLGFSFSKPLDAQIQHAARYLKYCEQKVHEMTGLRPQRPKVRFQRKRFTLYIRLLDARLGGASIGELGRFFFSDKAESRKSAQGVLRKAKEMAESGYRDLLLMPDVKGGEE